MNYKSSISRRETFNAAHRLYRPELSDEANFDLYGKCSYPNYHGHNYELHVTVIGDIDETTGFVYDIAKLKTIISEEVIEPFDHKNLNKDVVEFASLIPTVENIAMVIHKKLRERIENRFYIKVKLYETMKNYSEYPM